MCACVAAARRRASAPCCAGEGCATIARVRRAEPARRGPLTRHRRRGGDQHRRRPDGARLPYCAAEHRDQHRQADRADRGREHPCAPFRRRRRRVREGLRRRLRRRMRERRRPGLLGICVVTVAAHRPSTVAAPAAALNREPAAGAIRGGVASRIPCGHPPRSARPARLRTAPRRSTSCRGSNVDEKAHLPPCRARARADPRRPRRRGPGRACAHAPATAAQAPTTTPPAEGAPALSAAQQRYLALAQRASRGPSALDDPRRLGTTRGCTTASATRWPRSGTSCRSSRRSTPSRSPTDSDATWRAVAPSRTEPSVTSSRPAPPSRLLAVSGGPRRECGDLVRRQRLVGDRVRQRLPRDGAPRYLADAERALAIRRAPAGTLRAAASGGTPRTPTRPARRSPRTRCWPRSCT